MNDTTVNIITKNIVKINRKLLLYFKNLFFLVILLSYNNYATLSNH